MQVAPKFRCATEARRVAMARALDRHPCAILLNAGARRRAYADAAIAPVTPADDAEAVRRSLIFRAVVVPRIMGAAA